MEEGILSLKWNNHTSSFIHKLSSLHKIELYSDVTLACDGKYFPVHKFVLSVCSEYFEEILSKTKCQHPIIVLKDIKHTDLEMLLNYMYSGEANVSQSELSTLIKAAECLRIKGLAVPDEPPQKEKKRHSDSHKDSISSKRRRRENSPTSNHMESTTRDSDTYSLDKEEKLGASSHGYSLIPEIADEYGIKQEPKIEPPEPEEIDLETFDLHQDNLALAEDHLGPQHSQMLQDPSANQLPGPSGLQEDSLPWDPNFSNESFPGDDGNSQSMGLLSCTYCGKSPFRDRFAYDRHMRKHTGERPYFCPFCPFKASRGDNLKDHIKRQHEFKTQNEKTYQIL